MKHTHNQMKMAGLVMLSIAVSGCIQENCYEGEQVIPEKSIVAFIEQTPMTRVCIDPETSETGGSIAYYWTPEDEIGVFTDEGENNVLYYNTEPNDDVKSVFFDLVLCRTVVHNVASFHRFQSTEHPMAPRGRSYRVKLNDSYVPAKPLWRGVSE